MTAKEFIEFALNQIDDSQSPSTCYYAKGVLDFALELGFITRDEWQSLLVDCCMDADI